MSTVTIYDIKYETMGTSPRFFERGTLKFFGQTMKSFKVQKSPTGRTFLYVPSYWDGQLMGYTLREFLEGRLVRDYSFDPRTESEILEYIKDA